MFVIEDIVVDDTVARTQFHCDLARCKGACCTVEGGRGAPLLDHEVLELEAVLPHVRKYLSADHLAVIENSGIIEGPPGDLVTACFNHRACVFVMMDDGIAKCAIEYAFFRGEVRWRKPLSCHLFPIRIRHFGGSILYVEEFSECAPAIIKGKSENIPLYGFLHDALIRAYGGEWYTKFRDACVSIRRNSKSQ
jgi:hypothetical protein